MRYQIVGYTIKRFFRDNSVLKVVRLILANDASLELKFLFSCKFENNKWNYSVGFEDLYDSLNVALSQIGFKRIKVYDIYKGDFETLILKVVDNLLGFEFEDSYVRPVFCGWSDQLLNKYNYGSLNDVLREQQYDDVVLMKGDRDTKLRNVTYVNPRKLDYFDKTLNRNEFRDYESVKNNLEQAKVESSIDNGIGCSFFTSMILPLMNVFECSGKVGVHKPFYKMMKRVVKKYGLNVELVKKPCAKVWTRKSKKGVLFYEKYGFIGVYKNVDLIVLDDTDTEGLNYKVTKVKVQDKENPLFMVLMLAMMCDYCLENALNRIVTTPSMFKNSETSKFVELFQKGVRRVCKIEFL